MRIDDRTDLLCKLDHAQGERGREREREGDGPRIYFAARCSSVSHAMRNEEARRGEKEQRTTRIDRFA